jgi:hypothetical protein
MIQDVRKNLHYEMEKVHRIEKQKIIDIKDRLID